MAVAAAELSRSARAAEFQGVVMPKYLVFCFPDDSYDPDYDKPAGLLAECGLAKRWSYGTTVDAALPYQVYAGFVEGENAAAVRDLIRVKLATASLDLKGVDRFHLFVSGPEVCETLILR